MRRFTFCILALLVGGVALGDPYRFPGDVFSTGTVTGSAGVTTPNAVTFGWGVLTRYLFSALPSLAFGQRGLGWDDTHNELAVWDGSGWQDIVPGAGGGTGGGTVTSVALTAPSWLSVSGSPITGSGTLAVTAASGQTAHRVLGTGAGSSVSLQALTTADLPTIPIAGGGTGQTSAAAAFNALSPLTTNGDLLYGGSAGAGTRLGGNTTTARQWLSSTGTGVAANAPQWNALSTSDMPAGWPTLNQVVTNGNSTSNAVSLLGTVSLFAGAKAQDVSGTNAAGNALQLFGGISTGTAQGGPITFQTALTGTVSGTTPNSLQSRLTINAGGTSANYPPPSATSSLLQIGSTALAGGSGSGTYMGMNVPSGFGGDLLNYQKNGVSQFAVDNAGNITQNAVKSATVLGTDSNGKLQATTLPLPVSVGGTGASSFAAASLIGSDASSGTAALRSLTVGSGLTLAGSTLSANAGTGDGFDIGDIKATAKATAGTNWHLCDGSALSRTTYAALFSAIGTTYGAGDGSTTFNIPDGRGRDLFGEDVGGAAHGINFARGNTGTGSVTASGTTGNNSDNGVLRNTGDASSNPANVSVVAGTGPGTVAVDQQTHVHSFLPGAHTHSFSSTFNAIPPYFVGNWFIKVQ